jgi:hypothetical protein
MNHVNGLIVLFVQTINKNHLNLFLPYMYMVIILSVVTSKIRIYVKFECTFM